MTKRRPRLKSAKLPVKDTRGSLKGKENDKPFGQRWADYKRQEKALEEAKFARLRPP